MFLWGTEEDTGKGRRDVIIKDDSRKLAFQEGTEWGYQAPGSEADSAGVVPTPAQYSASFVMWCDVCHRRSRKFTCLMLCSSFQTMSPKITNEQKYRCLKAYLKPTHVKAHVNFPKIYKIMTLRSALLKLQATKTLYNHTVERWLSLFYKKGRKKKNSKNFTNTQRSH